MSALKRAVGYVRRSTDKQEQSLENQRRRITERASTEGFEIVEWIADDAVSGASISKRKGFRSLIARVESGRLGCAHIWMYDLSRLSRAGVGEVETFIYTCESNGVEVHFAAERLSGDPDLDEVLRPMISLQNKRENQERAKKTIDGQVTAICSGGDPGRQAPFGFDKLVLRARDGRPLYRVRLLRRRNRRAGIPPLYAKLTPEGELIEELEGSYALNEGERTKLVPGDPLRVKTVRQIFRWYANEGLGVARIARALNEPGSGFAPPLSGAPWKPSAIYSMLQNPAYKGTLSWNQRTFAKYYRVARDGSRFAGATRQPAQRGRFAANPREEWLVKARAFKGLVSPALWEKAARAARERAERCGIDGRLRAGQPKGSRLLDSPYMASGLLLCAKCGHSVHGTKRRNGKGVENRFYVCGAGRAGRCSCRGVLQEKVDQVLLDGIRRHLFMYHDRDRLLAKLEAKFAELLRPGQRDEIELRRQIETVEARQAALVDRLAGSLAGIPAVEQKLRDMEAQRQALVAAAESASLLPEGIDPKGAARAALASLFDFRKVLERGTPSERRQFIEGYFPEDPQYRPKLDTARKELAVWFVSLEGVLSGFAPGLVAGGSYVPWVPGHLTREVWAVSGRQASTVKLVAS